MKIKENKMIIGTNTESWTHRTHNHNCSNEKPLDQTNQWPTLISQAHFNQ